MTTTLTPSSKKSLPKISNNVEESTNQFTYVAPLAFAGNDENLYRYVGNNPLANVDPTGLARADYGPGGDPNMREPYEPNTSSRQIDGYDVKFDWAEGSSTIIDDIAGAFGGVCVPGQWGQPGEPRTSGKVSEGNQALSTSVTICGRNVCNTIQHSYTDAAGAIKARVNLKPGTYEILWFWRVCGTTDCSGGGASAVVKGSGNPISSLKIDKSISPVCDGGVEKSIITVERDGWVVIAEYKPIMAHTSNSKNKCCSTTITGEIGISSIKKK